MTLNNEPQYVFPWNKFHQIIFERGLVLEKTRNGLWSFSQASRQPDVLSPAEVENELGVRPLIVSGMAGGHEYEMVMPVTYGRLLDIYRSELRSLPMSVAFAMGAMLYHVKSLARWAHVECASFDWSLIELKGQTRCIITPEEPYYEFDSLLGAVVRGYEYAAIPLWKKYGTSGSPPRNFTRCLNNAVSIPDDLRIQIQQSHDCVYKKAKEYRDCIAHNIAVGSCSWAMMERLPSGLGSVLIRVPDNPAAKSSKIFTFDGELDALTLGWEYVAGFFTFADTLFGKGALSCPPQSS